MTGGAPAADAEDYARAEQFLPQSVVPALYNVTVEPHWIGDGPRFWYERDGRDGTEYVLVDPVNRTRRPAFDHARLARALANATGEAVDGTALPLASVAFGDDGATVTLRRVQPELGVRRGRAPRQEPGRRAGRRRPRLARRPPRPLPRRRQPRPPRARDRRRPGPDHERDRGLLLRQDRGRLGRTGDGRARERHGDAVCGLVARLAAGPHVPGGPAERDAPRSPPGTSPENGTLRPISYTYRYSMPGESVAQYEPVVIDVANGTAVRVDHQPWPHTSMMDAGEFVLAWWSGDGATVNSLYVERGEQTLRLLEEDPVSGAVREVRQRERADLHRVEPRLRGSPERPRERDERRGPLVLRAERLGAPVPLRRGRSADQRRDLGRLGRADPRRGRRRLDLLHGRRARAGPRPVPTATSTGSAPTAPTSRSSPRRTPTTRSRSPPTGAPSWTRTRGWTRRRGRSCGERTAPSCSSWRRGTSPT